MVTCISHSVAETEAVGETWGRAAEDGWVIGLSGELGAGKTQLVKGLARGLGITALVHSPTFTLVNVYAGGRLSLFHLDLYRLDTPEQIHAAGLEEYLRPEGVTVIEWAERWLDRGPKSGAAGPRLAAAYYPSPITGQPKHFRRVQLEVLSDTDRRITYEDFGA